MIRLFTRSFPSALCVVVASLVGMAGCSGPSDSNTSNESSAPTSSATEAVSNVSAQKATAVNKQEVAQAAQAFLTAIINGRQEDARKWLTPAAVKQTKQDKNLLNPLGFRIQKLEVGRVLVISSTEAAVEFQLIETGSTESEEICCLMKRSTVGWGVAGIACDSGPGEDPTIISFEHGQRSRATQPTTKTPAHLFVQHPPSLEGVSGKVRAANRSEKVIK